jgi:hypothetical protein
MLFMVENVWSLVECNEQGKKVTSLTNRPRWLSGLDGSNTICVQFLLA